MDDIDLDAAAQAGILGEDQVLALRNFSARRVGLPDASQEKFQLVSGLADFTRAVGFLLLTCGIAIGLGESLQIGNWAIDKPIRGHLLAMLGSVAVLTILLVGLFGFLTRNRYLARTNPATACAILIGGSIATYVLAATINVMMVGSFSGFQSWGPQPAIALGTASALAAITLFTGGMWYITRFPIIPAFWALITIISINAKYDEFSTIGSNVDYSWINFLAFITALPVFTAAIWFDLTDIRRETPRSQIAFWLHIVAGVILTRGCFGLISGDRWVALNAVGSSNVTGLVLVFLILLICLGISLILDRRSFLMSSAIPVGASMGIFGVVFVGIGLIASSYKWLAW